MNLNVMVDDISPERRTSAHQELKRLAAAIDQLPPKCRETIWLRRVDDLSQREVAAKLGIAEKTVEKHVMKGMKLLAAALRRGEPIESLSGEELSESNQEQEHGKP